MAEFTNGLLSGFQFVENLAERAERRRDAEARIGLARAADARAQGLYEQQTADRDRLIERQGRTDEANALLSRGMRIGLGNLEPYEMQRLEELSVHNPQIAQALQEHNYDQRDVDALQSFQGLRRATSQATQSQGYGVTQSPGGQPPGVPAAGAQPAPGFMSPDEVVAPDGEGPPEARGNGLVARDARFMQNFLQNTLGMDLPEELIDPVSKNVQFPRDLYDQLVALQDMPVVQREQERKQLRAQLEGKLPETVAFEKQAVALASQDVNDWQSFVDGDNRGGSALRELANSSPSLITNKLHQDWNTIQKQNPNLIPSLTREMYPVVEESVVKSTLAVQQLPVREDGTVDMRSQEARNAYRDFNNSLELMQRMSDSWSGVVEGRIRGGAMPIGNRELNGQLMEDVQNTPEPALPSSASERMARTTMASRAVQGVANGGRNLSTKQVQSLAWLAKRGYISAAGLQHFLDTGTFTDPKDAEFFDHDPKKALYRKLPDGTIDLVSPGIDPEAAAEAREQMFTGGQLEFIDDFFTGKAGDQKGLAEEWKTGFLVTLYKNPEALGMRGFKSNDIAKLTPGEIALLARRYVTFKHTESEYENGWWNDLLGRDFSDAVDDQGNPIDYGNFDDLARKYEIEVDALPNPGTDTAGYRTALSQSPDPRDRALSKTLSEGELRAIILEARAAQVNPPQ